MTQGVTVERDEIEKKIHDFGKMELKVINDHMAEPMREHLRKRGLTHKEIDGVFREQIEKHRK